jgi:integrase
MQDDTPRNPKRKTTLYKREVEVAQSASVQELIANSRSKELMAECEELIARLAGSYPYEALACELMLVSGLRLSEVVILKPHESMMLGGLRITQRTKNGRPRYIPFSKLPSSAQRQHQVYFRCVQHANTITDGSMKCKNWCKDRSFGKIRKVLESHCDPSVSLGRVDYMFQRAYARNLFEECMSCFQPPDSKEAYESTDVNSLKVQKSIMEVMHALGHDHSSMTIQLLCWPNKSSGLE